MMGVVVVLPFMLFEVIANYLDITFGTNLIGLFEHWVAENPDVMDSIFSVIDRMFELWT